MSNVPSWLPSLLAVIAIVAVGLLGMYLVGRFNL